MKEEGKNGISPNGEMAVEKVLDGGEEPQDQEMEYYPGMAQLKCGSEQLI